jgi:23S rRNA-/tRNA-specific pseudouridylate synthase
LAKHAIVGDSRYGEATYNQMIQEKYNVARLCLHSFQLQLSFRHKTYEWSADIPSPFFTLTGV